jgi:hypothetical protein
LGVVADEGVRAPTHEPPYKLLQVDSGALKFFLVLANLHYRQLTNHMDPSRSGGWCGPRSLASFTSSVYNYRESLYFGINFGEQFFCFARRKTESMAFASIFTTWLCPKRLG